MKLKRIEEIDGYSIITRIDDRTPDPEKTNDAIRPLITEGMTEAEIKQLYANNVVYAEIPNTTLIADNDPAIAKFAEKSEHQRLGDNGEYIPDYVGTEYWIKTDKWRKEKIEHIGVSLPAGSVLLDALTPSQQSEISAQTEAERIDSLTPEQKAAELQSRLDAAADEADRLERRAKIQGASFDTAGWYQEKKAEYEQVYA